MMSPQKLALARQSLFIPVTQFSGLMSGILRDDITVKDADGAAAAGVAVYVHVDEILEGGSCLGHLEFVSPTNANGAGLIAAGGPSYVIRDDDAAATGGVALYIDEDAAVEDERFLALLGTGRDCYVMLSDGRFIKIKYSAAPQTPGVQVYFDEDAAATHERLLFVSPTDANATVKTDDTMSMSAQPTRSMGTGKPVLVDVGGFGLAGLKMVTAGDDVRHFMLIPRDWDRRNPIRTRAWWTTPAAASGDRDIDWKVLYSQLIPNGSGGEIETPSDALDTVIDTQVPSGDVYAPHCTAWGVINPRTLDDEAIAMGLLVEMDAFDETFVEDKILLGIEFEYTPRWSSEQERIPEAAAWRP
jgi:hypothetical protein